ncbi:MAG: serine/threonine protein kinase [Deltaproteobacteria bacterium]|nr:serine/threonine protein kinase [Deltaproteobacteria bacterium]
MAAPVRLGRYILERRLAVGGMAEVFLGRVSGAAGFEKRVVIKRILPMFTADEQYVRLLVNEAKIASQMTHPNLVEVFGFEQIEGQYCLIMEYLEGHNLRLVIEQSSRITHKPPLAIAAWMVAEAAAGLHYAHTATNAQGVALNVVHRDISPENIIVTSHGHVKVVDFGVAKHDHAGTRTGSGVVMGKAGYMAPEQAEARRVDARSDIFSLGAVLYEMITLVAPFRRRTFLETISAVREARYRPVREHRRDVPPELEDIIDLMLAKDAAGRFRDAEAVSVALRQWLGPLTSVPAEETRDFISGLFSTTTVTPGAPYQLLDSDEVSLSGDLVKPEVEIDHHTYRILRDGHDTDENLNDTPRNDTPRAEPPRNDKTIALGKPTPVPGLLLEQLSLGATEPRAMAQIVAGPGAWSPPKTSRWPQVVLGVTLLVAAAIGTVIVVRGLRQSSATAPRRVSVDEPAKTGGAEPIPTPPARTGQLRLTTSPSGASVSIDSKSVGLVTPATIDNIDLKVGHVVRIERPGYRPVTQPLIFTPEDGDNVSWFVTLSKIEERERPPAKASPAPAPRASKANPAFLGLETDPVTDAFIDGKRIGTTPLADVRVAPGRHTLGLRTPDFGMLQTSELELQPGEKTTRRVTLRKGKLALDVRPWAVVYLCGKKIGTTPVPPLSVYEGSCTLKLVNPEVGVTRELPVTIRTDERTNVIENLEKH